MYCPKCGTNNPDDSIYCTACGEKLNNSSSNVCPHCGAENYLDAEFCSSCGEKLHEVKIDTVNADFIYKNNQFTYVKEEKNALNRTSFIISIIAAAITAFAYTEKVCLAGMSLACVSLVLLAIGLLTNSIKGNIRWNIALSIYGLLANFTWLAYLLWILPNF